MARKFFQGKYKPAAHRLARLRRRGKIPHLTLIPRDKDGRPQYQYAGWMVGQKGNHEYCLTEFCMSLDGGEWKRGPRVSQKVRPDAEWNPGRHINVEMDMGTESEDQVKERMDAYRGSSDPVLFVVHNAENPQQSYKRVLRLMSWGEELDQIALYITLDEIKMKGWDALWADGGGKGISLRKVVGKTP